jgi:hypothetical protein
MEFTLFHKGKVNDGKTDNKKRKDVVHDIRLEFHRQLTALRHLPPLNDNHKDWFECSQENKLFKAVDNKNFICLVSTDLKMYVDLHVDIFSAYKNRSFKDIDNKLKIIFDALQIPQKKAELPNNWTQSGKDENPLICLLSDDKLIYKLQVDTDYILQKEFFKHEEIACFIKVKIKSNKYNLDYIDLII